MKNGLVSIYLRLISDERLRELYLYSASVKSGESLLSVIIYRSSVIKTLNFVIVKVFSNV